MGVLKGDGCGKKREAVTTAEAQPACHRHSLTEGSSFAFSECCSRHHENRDPSFRFLAAQHYSGRSGLPGWHPSPASPCQIIGNIPLLIPCYPAIVSLSRRTIDPIRGSKTASNWTWQQRLYLFCVCLSAPSHQRGIPKLRFRLRHSPRNVFELWHWAKKEAPVSRLGGGDRFGQVPPSGIERDQSAF